MKDFMSIAIQVIFLLTGLGLAFWLLYFAIKSPRKDDRDHIDLFDADKKGKFIGRT